MAIILYPPELFNEKFLLSIRNCMLNLNDTHPVKKWIKAQSTPTKPDNKQQEKIDFLIEMLNSKFNLITDQKIKNKVISLISEIPENSYSEKVLKSYFYLMIGNITRSDNILKSIISQKPIDFYRGFNSNSSFYQRLLSENLEKVLSKFYRHPADRLTFYLFTMYIQSYLNQTDLIEIVKDLEPDGAKERIELSYVERVSPNLVRFLRLSNMSEKRLFKNLRSDKLSIEMQAYWVWPYLDIDPLISEKIVQEVFDLDKRDPLWAIYLLGNEKLADLYFNKGGVTISHRRQFLRKNLESKADFMLSLYKLIEIGDVDEALVSEVLKFMIHE